MPVHIEQLRSDARDQGLLIDADVGDARELSVTDASVDVVLLFGPLYHLITSAARVQCLREAARVVRSGGIVAAAAISRWAVLLDGVLRLRIGEGDPAFPVLLDQAIGSGVMAPLLPGGFAGYCHRPHELVPRSSKLASVSCRWSRSRAPGLTCRTWRNDGMFRPRGTPYLMSPAAAPMCQRCSASGHISC
jgi:SAM-dependent methyltransferase